MQASVAGCIKACHHVSHNACCLVPNTSILFPVPVPCEHLLLSLARLVSDCDMKGCRRVSSHVKLNDSWHVINAPINILNVQEKINCMGHWLTCYSYEGLNKGKSTQHTIIKQFE